MGTYAFQIHFDFSCLAGTSQKGPQVLVWLGAEFKGALVPGTDTQSSSILILLTISPQGCSIHGTIVSFSDSV